MNAGERLGRQATEHLPPETSPSWPMPSTFRDMTSMSGRSSTIFRGVAWLLLRSGRWSYFQANATEVDMILLPLLTTRTNGHMGPAASRSSGPVKVDRSKVAARRCRGCKHMSDEQPKRPTDAGADLEREVRKERKFSLAEAVGRLAGPGMMKGVSPITGKQQSEAEIEE
jgi:hypothetical protein